MMIDAVVSLASLIVPGVFDFVKKKFIKSEADTPERTLGSLAATKPEVLAEYTTALSTFYDAQTRYFNRDVSGTPSTWVTNLRATVRPVTVVVGLVFLLLGVFEQITLDKGTQLFFEAVIASWFGTRINNN